MRTSSVVVALLFAAAAAVASGHHDPAAGASEGIAAGHFGSLSPDAPPETAQFAFLIGEWRCQTRNMRPDGSLVDAGDATWSGYYILDGWAIQDLWRKDGGQPGTNIRSFNPKTGKWDNRWLAAGTLEWKYFEAEQVGDTMVMTGEGVDPQSRPYLDRNTFYEIGERSWKWRKDWSYDGGESWIEGVARIECRAAGADNAGDPPPAD